MAAAEAFQFRRFGIEHGSHDGTDAQYAAQQLGLARPEQMALQAVLEFPVQACPCGLQPVQVGLDVVPHSGRCGVQAGFLLGPDSRHRPPSHPEGSPVAGPHGGQAAPPVRPPARHRPAGQPLGIDAVGLGPWARGTPESADLTRPRPRAGRQPEGRRPEALQDYWSLPSRCGPEPERSSGHGEPRCSPDRGVGHRCLRHPRPPDRVGA